jgi:O-antigen biosynthesis protein WbqV
MVTERVAIWSGRRQGSSKKIPVLVVGDGRDAQLFIRGSHNIPGGSYRVVGVIPNSKANEGGSIFGIPILQTVENLERILESFREKGSPIGRLAITQEFLSPDLGRSNDDFLSVAQKFDATVSRLQSAENLQVDFDDPEVQLAPQMAPIAIEDLLGRKEHNVKGGAELTVLSGKTVLVTGGGGSIGSELCRQLARQGLGCLVVVDSCEFNLYKIENDLASDADTAKLKVSPMIADVRDKNRMQGIFQMYRPDYVFHAAALKHVPLVEQNPCEAALTNILGTKNIIDLSIDFNCKAAVLVSTDKAVNPTSFMGATKRAAEIYVQIKSDELLRQRSNITIVNRKVVKSHRGNTRLMSVRFGNVLGSSGSVVPLFEKQLQAGGPLTVTHPMVERFFMTVSEAVSLILNGFTTLVWKQNLHYTTFFLDMGQPVKIVDLATQMIRLAGYRPDKDIKIAYTGLRPGEKLYEELSYADELIINVEAEGLYAVSPKRVDQSDMRGVVDEVISAAQESDTTEVLHVMRRLVPEFKGQHHDVHEPGVEEVLTAAVPANLEISYDASRFNS